MLYNNMLHVFSEYWWHIAIAAGIFILLSFIVRDLRKQLQELIKYKRLYNDAISKNELAAEGTTLSSNYRIVGATKLFYEVTGLSSINYRELTLEDISLVFPDDRRASSVHRLEQVLERGGGNLELVILSSHNEQQNMTLELLRILDGNNEAAYYINVKAMPLVH